MYLSLYSSVMRFFILTGSRWRRWICIWELFSLIFVVSQRAWRLIIPRTFSVFDNVISTSCTKPCLTQIVATVHGTDTRPSDKPFILVFLQGTNYLFSLLSTRNLTWFHQGVHKERVWNSCIVGSRRPITFIVIEPRNREATISFFVSNAPMRIALADISQFVVHAQWNAPADLRLILSFLPLFAFSPVDVHVRWKYAECFKKLDQTSWTL